MTAGKPEAFRKTGRQSRSEEWAELLTWTPLGLVYSSADWDGKPYPYVSGFSVMTAAGARTAAAVSATTRASASAFYCTARGAATLGTAAACRFAIRRRSPAPRR